jgi:hypothetical protein
MGQNIAGEMVVAQGSFYRVEAMRRSGSREASDRRRWKFNAGHFKEWRERSQRGAMLTKGEGRRLGDALIRLLECGEGWPMAAHGTEERMGGSGSVK